MKLRMVVEWKLATLTISKLYIDDVFECYILEDAIRDKKVDGKTAIPGGEYDLVLEKSGRFGPDCLTVRNVPNYEYIRVHVGNDENDTEGCLLPGEVLVNVDADPEPERIGRSKVALDKLRAKVVPAIKASPTKSIKIKIDRI